MIQNLNIRTLADSGWYFSMSGTSSSDTGYSVSGGEDINNDGYDDVIVGAPAAASFAGRAYVIYGTTSPNNINLASLTPEQGFYITGTSSSNAGKSVSSAGDINKDGFPDILIGTGYSSSVYAIYGNATLGNLNLSSLTIEQGIAISGVTAGLEHPVSKAGDVNKDGFADIVIGDSSTNKVYILYGNTNPSNINLATLTLTQGIVITGISSSSTGYSVSNAGDVNKDGFDDIIIGAYKANKAYVIYGSDTLNNIDLVSLTSAQGVAITGVFASDTGYSVSGAGDVNKDGFADVIIGAKGINTAYVVYGSDTLTNIDLSVLTSVQGIAIIGSSGNVGWSVSDAGDENDDGYDDVLVGAPNTNTNAGSNAGIVYVIYGSNNLTNIDLNTVTSTQARSVTGASSSRFGYSVSNAGNIYRDAFADFIVGAPFTNNEQGAAYVIYGDPTAVPTIFPTLYPTSIPSKTPTNAPTFSPTLNPTCSPTNEYIQVEIITGGTYAGTSEKENFIVDSSEDTTITGGGGADTFTIMVHPAVNTTITDFNNTDELIDLTAFTNIHNIDDFTITSGSAVINLDDFQKVILKNLTPSDITVENFIFAPVSDNNEDDNNNDYGLIIGVTIGGVAVLGAVAYATCAYVKQLWPFDSNEPLAKMSELA